MARTLAEVLGELNEIYEADTKSVLEQLNNSSVTVIKEFRSKTFGAGKKEGKRGGDEDAAKLGELQTKLEEAEEALTKARSGQSTWESEKKDLEKKHETKLKETKDQLASARATIVNLTRNRTMDQVAGFLTRDSEELSKRFQNLQLGDVVPDYADTIVKQKFIGQIVVDETTGQLKDVLKLGEQTGYEADSEEQKLALLAADIRKTIPPTFIRSNAEGGAGIRDVGGSRQGSGPNVGTIVEKKAATGAYGM